MRVCVSAVVVANHGPKQQCEDTAHTTAAAAAAKSEEPMGSPATASGTDNGSH